jgi:hypothetical protein
MVSAGGCLLAGLLLEPRVLRELGQGAEGLPAQRAGALGHVVHDLVEGLVLPLEELVQVVELRANHVPVVVPGLGIEHILVREDGVEDLDDAVTVGFGDADIECHVSLPPDL